jgi:hypothetical protein
MTIAEAMMTRMTVIMVMVMVMVMVTELNIDSILKFVI